MTDNYAQIARDNLDKLYANLPCDLAGNLPSDQDGDRFIFKAFGGKCVIAPEGITLGKETPPAVLGILISLYALHACSDTCIRSPLKAFKEFPDTMPYAGAFTTHTENLMIPHVAEIKKAVPAIIETFNGEKSPAGTVGDFSFLVYPLPKIALGYIFYEEDDDFPASVTCLYSQNADRFLPIDGLADVGEYCSKKILDLI